MLGCGFRALGCIWETGSDTVEGTLNLITRCDPSGFSIAEPERLLGFSKCLENLGPFCPAQNPGDKIPETSKPSPCRDAINGGGHHDCDAHSCGLVRRRPPPPPLPPTDFLASSWQGARRTPCCRKCSLATRCPLSPLAQTLDPKP